jgi:hypothetical protein
VAGDGSKVAFPIFPVIVIGIQAKRLPGLFESAQENFARRRVSREIRRWEGSVLTRGDMRTDRNISDRRIGIEIVLANFATQAGRQYSCP